MAPFVVEAETSSAASRVVQKRLHWDNRVFLLIEAGQVVSFRGNSYASLLFEWRMSLFLQAVLLGAEFIVAFIDFVCGWVGLRAEVVLFLLDGLILLLIER